MLSPHSNAPADCSLCGAAFVQSQQTALLLLKGTMATNGALSGWSASTNYCTWPGVTCNSDGYVTELCAPLRADGVPTALPCRGLSGCRAAALTFSRRLQWCQRSQISWLLAECMQWSRVVRRVWNVGTCQT